MALNFANNNSLSAITTQPSGLSGSSMNLISTQTASGSATISFTSGIDDTYDSYVFKFYNIHPATADANFQFDTSDDGGSSYDTNKTTTSFRAKHKEDGSNTALEYRANADQAGTSATYQTLAENLSTGNDDNGNGELYLFNPSSTTFVKHFLGRFTSYQHSEGGNQDQFTAGYVNITAAVNAVLFRFHTGNIDSGVIKLYGIS
jgi:hypothetical protein